MDRKSRTKLISQRATEKKTLKSIPSEGDVSLQHRDSLTPFYLACLILLASVVYLNTLNNKFVFDDLPLIRDNPAVQHIEKIPSRFTSGLK